MPAQAMPQLPGHERPRHLVHCSRSTIHFSLLSATTSAATGYIQESVSADEKALPISSSAEPAFPEEQRRLFYEVLELMNSRGVPYAVSGAFALHEHTGIWRDTKDLDLFMTDPWAALALTYLLEDGFECEICDPVWLAKAHRGEYYVDIITGMSNAAIVVNDTWIERARPAEVFGSKVRVLAAEELIASKLFVTRRERYDAADICHVLHGARGRLDWPRLLSLAGEHWELLFSVMVLYHYIYPAGVDSVPAEIWDMLQQRFGNELHAHGELMKTFRGSLIDDKMFAIDVAEWGHEDQLSRNRERRLQSGGIRCELPPRKSAA